jgi:hypothetical protein
MQDQCNIAQRFLPTAGTAKLTLEKQARKTSRRQHHADPKSHGRDRVSNGRDVLPNADGRSIIARRYKTIASAIFLDQGGTDRCSESRKQLIRRFAAAAVLAEQMESRLANGEDISIAEHALLCSTLARLASRIGLSRHMRDVTPSLEQYLRGRSLEAAE